MRMSRLAGILGKNNDPFTFYDYMVADLAFSTYDDCEIPTAFTASDVKIMTTLGYVTEYVNTENCMLLTQRGSLSDAEQAHGFGFVRYLPSSSIHPEQRIGYMNTRWSYTDVSPDLETNHWYPITAVFNGSSTQLTISGVQYPSATTTYTDAGQPWVFFLRYPRRMGVSETLFYDLNDNLLAAFVPCVKRPGKYIGMYDRISDAFYPAYVNNVPQTLSSTVFSVGNFA